MPCVHRIAVVGAGYVGLTTGVSLAYLGYRVTFLEADGEKLARLARGEIPFYEPYLSDLFGLVSHRLHFTDRYEEVIPQAEVVFLAVGTPSLPDGRSDLSQVERAARSVGAHLGEGFTVVVGKSTLPPGGNRLLEAWVREAYSEVYGEEPGDRFAVASNPEFLREGQAIHDSLYPDRIVVGAEDGRALEVLRELYRPILEQSFSPPPFLPRPEGLEEVPFVATDLVTAELIKYGSNAFLALKISFINELARLAEKVGADIREVAKGIGLDRRIGPRFLGAGLGWGGSCFPKDTAALLAVGRAYGLRLPILEAVREINFGQRVLLLEKLKAELGSLRGKRIALLGLSFKPGTDDLRESPALALAELLLREGAQVRAHDPVALPRARKEVALPLEYAETPIGLLRGAHAVVLATDWPEYRLWPWGELKGLLQVPLVVDGRNHLDGEALSALGYRYVGVGVPPLGSRVEVGE